MKKSFGMNYYRLSGRKVVRCTMEQAAMQFEDPSARQVAETLVGPVLVSTIFLVIDHGMFGEGAPVLFETMAFIKEGEKLGIEDTVFARYSTFEAALAGHNQAVETLREKVSNINQAIEAARAAGPDD